MGLLGGRVVGPIGGAIITIPALAGHEWLAMPAAATAGLLGGLMRQAIPNKEDLWDFGPFTFLNIPRDIVRLVRRARMSWELLPLLACVILELGRVALAVATRSEEHPSELQSLRHLVCRLLLEKKKEFYMDGVLGLFMDPRNS